MLPESLRTTPQWLVSGEDKAPRSPKTGRLADVRDRSLYVTYDEAVAYASQHGLDIGFALTPDDPFAVIDLDEPENEEQRTRHLKILDAFNTYAELSRSGTGVHIWCRGNVPRGARRDKVEVYSAHRYMICTGRVVKDLEVLDCQEMLSLLFEEISRNGAGVLHDLADGDEILSDEDVIAMAMGAANADKFNKLCNGEWEGDYPSQSEADYALMNMLCYYSDSNEQCRRLFRYSKLGRREKAQRDRYLNYMIGKIRGEQPPRVDFSGLLATAPASSPTPVAPPVPETPDPIPTPIRKGPPSATPSRGIPFPPGFIGEVARYILETSTRPVPEVSVTASLAMFAGILGRQFNISGTGLNQYIILLAKTGVGKEDGPAGIERLVHAVRDKVPSVDTFIGPGTFASGQGLVRTLDEKPVFFSVLGEFGLTLQMLSDHSAGGHIVAMRRVLLDLYSKSGQTARLHSSAYSDKEKNTKIVIAPALTIYGESQPEIFYAGLTPTHIEDGLIPRFLVVEYSGDRPNRNPRAFEPPPDPLVQRLADLIEMSLRMMANQVWADVQLSEPAGHLMAHFDRVCDDHIRSGGSEVHRQLWNRAHLKALRLAGLVAVADRPHHPVVTEEEASWAIQMVRRDLTTMAERFEQGDVGEGLTKQLSDVRRMLQEFVNRPHEELASYGVTLAMYEKKVVPYVYLLRRVAGLASFRNDRRGASAALRGVVQEMVDSDLLAELPRQQSRQEFGYGGKMYHINKEP